MKDQSTIKKEYAIVSAVGRDRPGIVAAVSKVLYEAGCNLEDSSMSILGGEFAIILIVTLPSGIHLQDLDNKFDSVRNTLKLTLFLKSVTSKEIERKPLSGHPYMISVYGVDKPGIVYKVTQLLSSARINVTDVNTKKIDQKGSAIYMMMLEVDCPKSLKWERFKKKLEGLGTSLAVTITCHPIETLTL